jgi:hypothetical protein
MHMTYCELFRGARCCVIITGTSLTACCIKFRNLRTVFALDAIYTKCNMVSGVS